MPECKHINYQMVLAMADGKAKTPNRAKGALKVAENMTPEQLKERARKGAMARWAGKPIRAFRKGSFKEHFGVDVDCYVLDDARRTAVISQTGMAVALGLSPRGNSFPSFIGSQAMAPYVSGELRQKLEKFLLIQWVPPGGELPPIIVHGHEAALLIEVCNAIAAADRAGALGKRYKGVVQQASIINGASAKAGITGLVYALAGYRPEIEEVIHAFKAFVQEEAKKYEAEFPNELYEAWMKLYKIQKPTRGKNWKAMHLTRQHIYYPLAESNGKVLELLKALKAKGGDRNTKLFQFLNDIGARALRMQIGRVLEMAQSSKTPVEYEGRVDERFFKGQRQLDLELPEANL